VWSGKKFCTDQYPINSTATLYPIATQSYTSGLGQEQVAYEPDQAVAVAVLGYGWGGWGQASRRNLVLAPQIFNWFYSNFA